LIYIIPELTTEAGRITAPQPVWRAARSDKFPKRQRLVATGRRFYIPEALHVVQWQVKGVKALSGRINQWSSGSHTLLSHRQILRQGCSTSTSSPPPTAKYLSISIYAVFLSRC